MQSTMKMLVDVHAHLDNPVFADDLDQVIKRAKAAGIIAIIQNGICPKSNKMALGLAEQYDVIKAALGLHPAEVYNPKHDEGKIDVDKEISFIEKNKDRIIAIGEVGLDYHWAEEKKKEQKKLFEKMISLAERTRKPLIVHTRKAESDAIEVLESSKIKNIVMHCFGGNTALTKRISDNGWSFSIPANVIRDSHFQRIVEIAPTEQIFCETDCPFLSPEKGKRSEPAMIADSIRTIARLKGLTDEETEGVLFTNYQRMFL